jgi:hypothetical protein
LERSCSLLSEQINTTYSQWFTSDSLTTVLRILALPLSSTCRSLNQTSLKEPDFVTLRDNLAYYSCMLQMTAEKLFTCCVFPCEMTVCTVFHSVTPTRFYPEIKHTCQHKKHILKNRLRGATQSHYIIHIYTDRVNIHLIYNNSHYALCPQRIFKPNGPFP